VKKSEPQQRIDELQKELELLLTDWASDGSSPCNYVRENGTRKLKAKVDRWCGHYQEPHSPHMIGWSVNYGNYVERGFVLVSDWDGSVEDAIHQAKVDADEAIEFLMQDKHPGFYMEYETDEDVCGECGQPVPLVTNAGIRKALNDLGGLDELRDALSRTEDEYVCVVEGLVAGEGPKAVGECAIDEQLARVIGAAKDVREALGLDNEGL